MDHHSNKEHTLKKLKPRLGFEQVATLLLQRSSQISTGCQVWNGGLSSIWGVYLGVLGPIEDPDTWT